MKKKEWQDLRNKSSDELQKILQETQKDMAIKKLELSMRKHTNVHIVKALRKNAARIKTIMREKELGGQA